MKNGMLTIFRKELARFFGDKRTALGTILLPGILIFAVYTFMGSALSDQFSVDEDFFEELEESLILSDMGMETTLEAVETCGSG